MLEAHVEEEKRQDDVLSQRLAWQTAHLMNASGNFKKRISATDLYKPLAMQEEQKVSQPVVKKFESKEAKKDYLDKLFKKFNN